jgi:cation transport ATPase
MTDTLDRPEVDAAAADRPGLPAPEPHYWVLAAVVAVSVGALGFRLGGGAPPVAAALTAAAVLLGGCPVAVLLAPRAVLRVGARRARRIGVPLSAAELNLLGRVDTVALRRSRFRTVGEADVRDVVVAAGATPATVLRLAGAVERAASHPLARAVAAAAGPVPDAADLDVVPGRGVRGVVAELVGGRVVAHAVLAGSPAFLREHDVGLPDDLDAARAAAEAAGPPAVAVAWDGVARGVLELVERTRPDAVAAVATLLHCGVRPVLVTGAARAVAEAQGTGLGLAADQVIADVVPGEAPDVVRWLVAYGRVVASTGTGGGHLELPVEPHGPAAVADAVRLAVRVRRVGAGLRTVTAAVALGGAAAGLLDPLAAATAPVIGLVLVAAGLVGVAGSGTARGDDHPAARSGGAP